MIKIEKTMKTKIENVIDCTHTHTLLFVCTWITINFECRLMIPTVCMRCVCDGCFLIRYCSICPKMNLKYVRTKLICDFHFNFHYLFVSKLILQSVVQIEGNMWNNAQTKNSTITSKRFIIMFRRFSRSHARVVWKYVHLNFCHFNKFYLMILLFIICLLFLPFLVLCFGSMTHCHTLTVLFSQLPIPIYYILASALL